jgi:outer membrane protein W
MEKKKLGLELAIGIKPSQIIVYLGQSISVEHTYNFNTNYIEIDANYYFKTVNENFRPLIGIGIGYIKLTGDSKTNGALLNFAGGICYSPFKKISVNAGIDGRLTYYINYVESELVNEYFTRTIHFFPIVIYLGFSFQLN